MEEKLWEACSNGKVEEVQNLLQNSQININWQNQNFNLSTPFHIACSNGWTEIVRLLLNDNRVDINKAASFGWTPFFIACGNRNIEIVKLLLNDKRVDVNKTDKYNYTPLLIACYDGYTEIVKLLLNDNRVDINQTNDDGSTPFLIACLNGETEVIKYLLVSGKEIDINKKDNSGKTGLDIAKEKMAIEGEEEFENWKRKLDYPKIVKLIESFQMNPNETRENLTKKLAAHEFWEACSKGKIEEVRKLLKNEQINVNQASDGKTPFSISCEKGHIDIVKLLLNDKRVDINKANYEATPFYVACRKGHIEIVKLLLKDKRIDTNKADNDGWTPLYVACQNGHFDIVKLLLNDKRISIRKKTNNGSTAFDIAKEYSHLNIVKLIKEIDTEQRYREYLETFQSCPFFGIENETINKQDFLVLNEHLKKNKNIKELRLINCGLTPSITLEILKTSIWKYENGQLGNIQKIEIDDIELQSTEGLEIIPIEIRNQGTKSIVQYILDLCKSPNSNPLYRTKLMVVGYENVGKTTILDCLFPIRDLGETKGKLMRTEYLIELQGKYFRRYKPKELDKVYKEIILENEQWSVEKVKETGLELIPLKDKNPKKIEIYFKDEETRDRWIERLKRVIRNAATHGIEIQDQILKSHDQRPSIDVSIWDFAGQHDYYNNHHYFLSTRTVFLVLWKMKDDEKDGLAGLKFWFKSLSAHLKHDPTSLVNNKPYFSISVVGTFLDDQNVDKSEESKKFREKEILEIAKSNGIYYPIQIYEVSCSTMENIDGLKQDIYETALTHGYMGEKLPIGYLNIKNSIEELRNQEKFKNLPIIEIQELVNYNKTNSTFEFDDEFIKRALKLLHLWGTCVYFDEPKELSNYVVLKPEFLTKEVMGKLFKPNLRNNFKDGILNHSDLNILWLNYMDKVKMLMSLMERFEICFKLKEDEEKPFNEQRSLIVSYLPENEPNDLSTYWSNESSTKNEEIQRTVQFNMIPKEMVSRLFVCLQHNIEDQLIWRYGMAFTSKGNKNIEALVNVETELINQNVIERTNSISTSNNQKGNSQAELKNSDRFQIQDQIIIKVRGKNLRDRKELMDNIVEEIWKCSKKYSGVVCYQMISYPFDSTPSVLIKLSECLLEITKPKDKQGIKWKPTQKVIDPVDLLLKSGMIYQREVIEEKKKEIEEVINKVKNENNLNEDQTQELLHHPQLTSILMTEILKNENQDSSKNIESELNEDISIKRNQKLDQDVSKKDSENNGNNEDLEDPNIPDTRNQSQNESQNQELTQMMQQMAQQISSIKNELSQGQKLILNEVGSAVGDMIHTVQQQKDHEYPACYLLLPMMKEQSSVSTFQFRKVFQKIKETAEDLIFDKSQLHCFCEFKARSQKNGQLQPLFHPTNSSGIEVKELNNVMKKVGPTLKVASVILKVISIGARFAGIPFPHVSEVIDQVVEYSEKAQEIFGNCEMKIESLKEMTNEDLIQRMNQNGTSELKLQPLGGDIIGIFKKENMFGEVQNGYVEKAGLHQISIKFDNEYGNRGDVLWVCEEHYNLLQQINNNQSIELDESIALRKQMADIFFSSWSTLSVPSN